MADRAQKSPKTPGMTAFWDKLWPECPKTRDRGLILVLFPARNQLYFSLSVVK